MACREQELRKPSVHEAVFLKRTSLVPNKLESCWYLFHIGSSKQLALQTIKEAAIILPERAATLRLGLPMSLFIKVIKKVTSRHSHRPAQCRKYLTESSLMQTIPHQDSSSHVSLGLAKLAIKLSSTKDLHISKDAFTHAPRGTLYLSPRDSLIESSWQSKLTIPMSKCLHKFLQRTGRTPKTEAVKERNK